SCRSSSATTTWARVGRGSEKRHIERTTNGRPAKWPAESLGSADARRFMSTTSLAESAGEKAAAESTGNGATTPPKKPTLHGRGGGAARRLPNAQTPLVSI